MQLHLNAKRLDVTPALEEAIAHHLERLRPRLRHFAPDLVHLDMTIQRHPRRQEYSGSLRLSVAGTLLPAQRNRAETVEGLIKAAFDDLEKQLSRFKSRLRREHAHERKRASLPAETVAGWERELLEERELLDQSIAGDLGAFERLLKQDLPAVRRGIAEALVAGGQEPRPELIEQVLSDVLTVALRQLPRKPARWSMTGWLTWLARKEVSRRAQNLPVAQTAEIRD